METTVSHNEKGFTLVEFLVAILILMVGLLGLLQTVNYAVAHNMTNQLRQEAVLLADERMQTEMAKRFDSITIGETSETARRVVNGAQHAYTVRLNNTQPTTRTINISLQLTWSFKGRQYNHAISSLVSQYE